MTEVVLDADGLMKCTTVRKYRPWELDDAIAYRDHLDSRKRNKRWVYILELSWYYVRLIKIRPAKPREIEAWRERFPPDQYVNGWGQPMQQYGYYNPNTVLVGDQL